MFSRAGQTVYWCGTVQTHFVNVRLVAPPLRLKKYVKLYALRKTSVCFLFEPLTAVHERPFYLPDDELAVIAGAREARLPEGFERPYCLRAAGGAGYDEEEGQRGTGSHGDGAVHEPHQQRRLAPDAVLKRPQRRDHLPVRRVPHKLTVGAPHFQLPVGPGGNHIIIPRGAGSGAGSWRGGDEFQRGDGFCVAPAGRVECAHAAPARELPHAYAAVHRPRP